MRTNFNYSALLKANGININPNNVTFLEGDILHRVSINGASGTYDLVTDNTQREVGISDFSGKELPSGEVHVVEGIYLGYASEASANTLARLSKYAYHNQRYGEDTAPKHHNFPSELLSANLIISQDNKVLFKVPVARLAATGRDRGGIDNDCFALQKPFVLRSKFPVDIRLEFGNSAAMPADKQHLVEVRMLSKRFINR